MNGSQIWAAVQSVALVGSGVLVSIPNPYAQLAAAVLGAIAAAANHTSAAPAAPAK